MVEQWSLKPGVAGSNPAGHILGDNMKLHEYVKKYEEMFEEHMKELKSIEKDLRKIISLSSKASAIEKEQAAILLTKITAAHMPYTFDNISISQSRGLERIYSWGTGKAIADFIPNGRESCQIQLWNGMSNYESDPHKMHT